MGDRERSQRLKAYVQHLDELNEGTSVHLHVAVGEIKLQTIVRGAAKSRTMLTFTFYASPTPYAHCTPRVCDVRPGAKNGDTPRRRRRGRPRGSRNKKKSEPVLDGSGASSAGEKEDGYEKSFAENFHMLLPILAEEARQAEAAAKETEEQQALREFIGTLIDRYLSTYRRTAQDENLRPFREREQAAQRCGTCGGEGEVKCEYCGGWGFLQFGGNSGREFEAEFQGWTLEPPKHVVGNYYHCPLCGGRCKTRCEECAGTGSKDGLRLLLEGKSTEFVDGVAPRYAAKGGCAATATEAFDFDAFVEEHKENVEWTHDGLLILRAGKRRGGALGAKHSTVGGPQAQDVAGPQPEPPPQSTAEKAGVGYRTRRKRGRPRKEDAARPSLGSERRGTEGASSGDARRRARSNRRSTDFLNTTDFQMGQKLSSPRDDTSEDGSAQDDS